MNPRKKRRIEELLRRELSSIILYDMKDPRTGFATVTRVKLAEDQRSAEVLLIVRGGEEETEQTLQVLTRARGYVQALIAKRLDLRYTPVLSFSEDEEVLEARRLESLIDETRREDQEYGPQ